MNKQKSPFGKLRFCLRFIADEHMRDTILEDMENSYACNLENKGAMFSWLVWFGKLLMILVSFFLKSCVWRTVMFKNYMKITIRNVRKHTGYSLLNIAGLAVGIACTILILLWVKDELSFDRFHENSDRIFRVVFSSSDDGVPTNANGAFPVGPALKKDFPEVIETVRIRKLGQNVKRYVGYKDKKFYEPRFFFAEPACSRCSIFLSLRGPPSQR